MISSRVVRDSTLCFVCPSVHPLVGPHFQMLLSRPNNAIRGLVRLSVGPSISLSVMIQLKSGKKVALDVWGGGGCGCRFDAPAHPSKKIL